MGYMNQLQKIGYQNVKGGQNLKISQKISNLKNFFRSFLIIFMSELIEPQNFFADSCRGDNLEQIHV